MQRVPFAAPLIVCCVACATEFELPDVPVESPPRIDGFEPASGFSGLPVRIRGVRLGEARETVEVRFGDGSAVRASAVFPDGSVEAVVPDDATSGRVSVSGPHGTAASETEFTYRGLGRLRFGRVAAEADLRLALTAALVLPGGGLFVHSREHRWAATYLGGVLEPLPEAVGAVAISGDRRWLFFVGIRGTTACPDGFIERRASSTPHEAGARACIRDIEGTLDPSFTSPTVTNPGLEANDDGSLAYVSSHREGWVARFDGGTAVAQRLAEFAVSNTDRIAWAGGRRFVLAMGANLVRVEDAPGGPVTTSKRMPGETNATSLDALPDGRYAVATCESLSAGSCGGGVRILLYDAFSDELPAASLPMPDDWVVDQVRFSPDGTRLVVAQRATGTLTTFDLSDPDVPALSVAHHDFPITVHADQRHFFVSGLGGVAHLSQRTGLLISQERVPVGLHAPRLRKVRCAEGPILEVGLRSVNAILRRVPSTLRDSFDCSTLVVPGPGRLEGLEAHADADWLVARVGNRLRRYVDARDEEAPVDGWVVPGEETEGSATRLVTTPDGRALLVLHDASTTAASDSRVGVLDPSRASWTPSDTPTSIGVTGALLFASVAADARGRFLVATQRALKAYDVASALAGTEQLVGVEHAIGWRPTMVAASEQRFYVATNDLSQSTDSLLYVVGDPATLPEPIALASVTEKKPFHVAPGERRLWFIDGTETRRLVTVPIDPRKPSLSAQERPLDLPPGASALYAYPDGEHVIVVDTREDRLLLLE